MDKYVVSAVSSMGPFDPQFIKHWWHQSPPTRITKRAFTHADIESTRKWTSDEVVFFKIHTLSSSDWQTYIAPSAALTAKAQQIANCTLGVGAFIAGDHLDTNPPLPEIVLEFAESIAIIYNSKATESSSDRLAHVLLSACNPDLRKVVDVPQMKQIVVKV
eukprot:Phypoly_transcript_13051.p1 GENE.Phypoly_transcript_13051~~Phypoly_transcript_13051.p1  ORF type:complete len:182 (+),score=17.08 Phypoly_transcript_13051:66-548(+)